MSEYIISASIQEESNEDQVSVTGAVNGMQVGTVLNARALPDGTQARRKAINEALVDAYIAKTAAKKSARHPHDQVVVRA